MPGNKANAHSVAATATHPRGIDEKWRTFLRLHREGARVIGVVRVVQEYGAFVELPGGMQGLVHRSEILPGRVVEKVEAELEPGDRVEAVIQRIDMERRQVHLSIAAALQSSGPGGSAGYAGPPPPGAALEASAPHDDGEAYAAELRALFSGLKARPGQIQRILLVEDQEDVRDSLKSLLEEAGYTVAFFRDGGRMLDQAAAFDPHLILLDAHIPGLEGVELAPMLSAACPAALVILMTGNPFSPSEERRLAALPRVDWLEKPFDPPELDDLLIALEAGRQPALLRRAGPGRLPGSAHPAEPVTTPRVRKLHKDLRASARRLLEGLVEDTRAAAGAVFEMDLVTHQVGLLVSVGIDETAFERGRLNLRFSPVKDVILDHEKIHESDAVANRPGKFQYLLVLLDFSACLGVHLVTAGKTGYALFLFHPTAGHYTPARKRQAENIALALSALIERAQIEKGLIADQKYSLPGKMSAGLTHEVNNRMVALENESALISEYLQRLGAALPEAGGEISAFKALCRQAVRLAGTVKSLSATIKSYRDLSKIPEADVCYPEQVVRQVCDLLYSQLWKKYEVNLQVLPPPPYLPKAGVNEVALQQALINLILNAAQQVRECGRAKGWVRVSVERNELDPARPVRVLVADNGPGIHGRLWERVFELGFSTRPNGSGLGLFVSRCLLEPSGGEVAIQESLVHAGTTFAILLPAAPREKGA